MSENGATSIAAPLIRLEGISKVFLTEEIETHALSGVSLEIHDGQFVSVAGPSGCGKSTLLSLLGLLDSPTEGVHLLDGQPVETLSAADRARIRNRHIGFIFQAFNLIGDLTVYENVELPLTYRGGVGASERKERVLAALDRVDMSHRRNHYPAQLSGGQQQRVAVARAVAGDPLILLADEPTGNLDSTNGSAVMDLVKELHEEGATICMVTHDPRYTEYAQRSVHLFDGRIVEDQDHPEAAIEELRESGYEIGGRDR
ncbi:MAG: ABC transporter ATP-binding protein [Gemmatimonadota bacterium]|jgi:putative ABC transport system ATP-binding protein